MEIITPISYVNIYCWKSSVRAVNKTLQIYESPQNRNRNKNKVYITLPY